MFQFFINAEGGLTTAGYAVTIVQQFYLQLQPLFSPEGIHKKKIKYQTAGLLLYGFST